MIFKSISINNFRGIKKAEISDFSRVNLFLGKNNSGKTSILEALFLLSGPRNPNVIIYIDNNRFLNHDEEDDFRFAFYKLDYNNEILLSAIYDINNEVRELIIKSTKTTSLKPQSSSSSISTTSTTTSFPPSGSTIDASYVNLVDGVEFDYSTKKSHSQKKEFRNSIKLIRNGNLITFQSFNLNNTTEGKREDFMGLLQNSSFTGTGDLPMRLNKLIVEKKKSELLEPLQLVDKRIVDFELGLKNIINFDIGAERLIPANLMGDGILRLMTIITNIYFAKDGILLIDEVDNGLHFSTLKLLWKIIFNSAKKYNCQIFVTTHNVEIITYLDEVLKETDSTEYQKDIRCFTIMKSEDDNLVPLKYDFEKLNFAIERKFEIRDNI